jgi:hypothetical protein
MKREVDLLLLEESKQLTSTSTWRRFSQDHRRFEFRKYLQTDNCLRLLHPQGTLSACLSHFPTHQTCCPSFSIRSQCPGPSRGVERPRKRSPGPSRRTRLRGTSRAGNWRGKLQFASGSARLRGTVELRRCKCPWWTLEMSLKHLCSLDKSR